MKFSKIYLAKTNVAFLKNLQLCDFAAMPLNIAPQDRLVKHNIYFDSANITIVC